MNGMSPDACNLPRPDPDSYWVIEGRLLAGPFPGSFDDDLTRLRLAEFIAAGVSFFLDLTSPGERPPYHPFLKGQRTPDGRICVYRNLPVPDFGVPPPSRMHEILATISRALGQGHTVYLHCWGGIGRTGTAVGCLLVEEGFDGDRALAEVQRLLDQSERGGGGCQSPETGEQRKFVRDWVHFQSVRN